MPDLVAQLHVLDNEPSARRRQQLWIQRPPCGWPSDPPGRRVLPGQFRVTQVAPPNLDIGFSVNQSAQRIRWALAPEAAESMPRATLWSRARATAGGAELI
jgi:hypothetical protein